MRKVVSQLFLILLAASGAIAQYKPAPTTYTMTAEAPGETIHVYRDGDHALVDTFVPKDKDQPVEVHTRTLVNVAKHQDVTWDVANTSIPCGPSQGQWPDPFSGWDQFTQGIKGQPKQVGHEAVNGIPATVFQVETPDGPAKIWRDDTYGLVLKVVATPPGGGPAVMSEVKEFKTAKPDPALFKAAERCHSNL